MTSMSVSVTFECKNCGGTILSIPNAPTEDSIKEDDTVFCKSCGTEVGRWGDVKSAAVTETKKKIVGDLKDAIQRASKGDRTRS